MEKILPILYAEDNDNDIELTLAAFRECNLKNRIDVVKDGQEVIDYLTYQSKYNNREKEHPVVVLLDIKMPRVDGLQALKFIKENSDLKHIPVVMLTSSSMEKDLIESYELGANAYVIKPIDFIEFMDSVKNIGAFWALINKTA